MKRILKTWGVGLFLIFVSTMVFAKETFDQFLVGVRQEAISQGVRPEVVDAAFKNLSYHQAVVNFDKRQPEKKITYLSYRQSRIDPFRIKLGQQEYKKNQTLLEDVGAKYGVDPCIIVAIWGLETSYGRFMGQFPVIKSLATLAYEGRRGDFFRKQLLQALHILNGDHVKLADFKGEWAGASGHPQFLPSSWYDFAVDYDGDGKKDIWKNTKDALASIANYLHKSGWVPNQRSSIEVTLPAGFDGALVDSKKTKPVKEWVAMGVRPAGSYKFPGPDVPAALIHPDGGPIIMTFKNWNVIMLWNRSNYYAGSVTYLADQVCKR